MKPQFILATAALLVAAAWLMAQSVSAQEEGPPPSAGTKIAEGLAGSQGAAIGPDGALYVTLSGTGGDTEVTPPDDFPPDEPVPTFGLTGTVARIDPATGEVTTAGSGLPSIGGEEGAGGAVDVAFMGSTMYVLTTGDADEFGQEEWPNGIYRVAGSDVELIANIGEFNRDNPVDFPDAGPGGNPFAIDVRGTEFYVTDGNHNRVLRATTAGAASIVTTFDNVVPTGLETGSSGPILMTQFGAFPQTAANSFVVSVALPTGNATNVASGFAQLIDVENGPGGTYALQFGSTDTSPDGDPFSGKILTLAGSTLTPLVTGFMLPTSLDFSGDTAYVTTLLGEVWQIEDFSTVEPPPAVQPTPVVPVEPGVAPTATPRTGVTAPDTGTGPGGGNHNVMLLVALAIGAIGMATGAVAVATRRA
ncbi:MAG: ScyD/ScyE family protein [Dehalococcoidia bacterium]